MVTGRYPAWPLTPFWKKERVLLVRGTDALGLCGDGSFERLPRNEVAAYLPVVVESNRAGLRDFILHTGFAFSILPATSDRQLVELVQGLIRSADLVLVRACEAAVGGKESALVMQRRLVRSIEAKIGSLVHEGRRYKLVADADWRRLPGQDDYVVVGRSEATRVLGWMAQQAGRSAAGLLVEAGKLLTEDWRPPFSPNGLVFLRRTVAVLAPKSNEEPAVTPSQLATLIAAESVELSTSLEVDEPLSLETTLELDEPLDLETVLELEDPPESETEIESDGPSEVESESKSSEDESTSADSEGAEPPTEVDDVP
jgi:hypothetical protein